MDGTALQFIDALLRRNAINKAPRAAGYRGSDFVLWHLFLRLDAHSTRVLDAKLGPLTCIKAM
jgi:hypothetical protein